jgi:hypothetical protein
MKNRKVFLMKYFRGRGNDGVKSLPGKNQVFTLASEKSRKITCLATAGDYKFNTDIDINISKTFYRIAVTEYF